MYTLKLFKPIFPLVLVLFFISCTSDDGGTTIIEEGTLGLVFEIETDFNQANEFSSIFTFPNSIEVFEADQVLVFLLEDVIDEGNGVTTDVFTPIPQSFFLPQGTLQYGFNHTFNDVSIFLTGDFDLNTIDASFTQDQVFRVVVLPGEFAQSLEIDTQNFELLMTTLNKNAADIIKVVR